MHLADEGSARCVSRRIEDHRYSSCGNRSVARRSKNAMHCVRDEALREYLNKKERVEDAFSLFEDLEKEIRAFLERIYSCLLEPSVVQRNERELSIIA